MPGIKDVIIGLDTSSSPLVAVVERGGKKYASRRKGVKQERLLFPVLKQLLTKAGADLTHTAKVAIIRGPGRFTGIRISLTFASMLKYLSGAKVYGITVFEAVRLQVAASKRFLTWKAQKPAGSLAVVWHAFREEYFLQIFNAQSEAPQWLSREELLARLAARKEPLFVAGTDKEHTPLETLLEGRYTLADFKDCIVRPETLVAVAQNDAYQKDALEPLYLKPARFELLGK